jgi:hypothetical protein
MNPFMFKRTEKKCQFAIQSLIKLTTDSFKFHFIRCLPRIALEDYM